MVGQQFEVPFMDWVMGFGALRPVNALSCQHGMNAWKEQEDLRAEWTPLHFGASVELEHSVGTSVAFRTPATAVQASSELETLFILSTFCACMIRADLQPLPNSLEQVEAPWSSSTLAPVMKTAQPGVLAEVRLRDGGVPK